MVDSASASWPSMPLLCMTAIVEKSRAVTELKLRYAISVACSSWPRKPWNIGSFHVPTTFISSGNIHIKHVPGLFTTGQREHLPHSTTVWDPLSPPHETNSNSNLLHAPSHSIPLAQSVPLRHLGSAAPPPSAWSPGRHSDNRSA